MRTPGEELLVELSRPGMADLRAGSDGANAVRERFETAVVAVVGDSIDGSDAESRAQVRTGTWTENGRAAAFFTDAPPRVAEQLRAFLTGKTPFGMRAEHVARELHDRLETGGRDEGAVPSASPNGRVAVDDLVDGRSLPLDRRTNRWGTLSAVALVAISVGVLTRSPALLLVSALPIAVGVLSRSSSPPEATLEVTRELDLLETDAGRATGGGRAGETGAGSVDAATGDTTEAAADDVVEPATGDAVEAEVGDEVRVRVSLENVGDRWLPDVRFLDDVPHNVEVVDGSPRCLTSLRPGASAQFAYTLRLHRGAHRFGAPIVTLRDATRTWERVERLDATERTITCDVTLERLRHQSLGLRTTRAPGTRTSAAVEAGQQFHSLREYARGDPLNRIAWTHRAKTGELATVGFHESRRATVMILLDARRPGSNIDASGRPVIERSIDAARRLVPTLLEEGHLVGVGTVAPEGSWVAPGGGPAHRLRLRRLLSRDESLRWRAPMSKSDGVPRVDRLLTELPRSTQLLVVSPLCDDGSIEMIDDVRARGYAVRVVAPDPTSAGTPMEAVARAVRERRLRRLAAARVPTIDWEPDVPLETALLGGRGR